jgi:hypothetical protein
MNHYDWPLKLRVLYDKALDYYGRGGRDAEEFLTAAERAELGAIGIAPINLFDFAEDFLKHGEPPWETFLLVASARRDYFLYELGGKPATTKLREEDLPPKKEAMDEARVTHLLFRTSYIYIYIFIAMRFYFWRRLCVCVCV